MLICPCNVHPLTPHFYIVKLGFTGVYIIFLFLLQSIDCGYSLEPPHCEKSLLHGRVFEIGEKDETCSPEFIHKKRSMDNDYNISRNLQESLLNEQ